MRGSAWHYATHLLAPRSFHSAAGCNGGRQAAEGRSRGQVGVSVAPPPPGAGYQLQIGSPLLSA